MTRDEAIKIYQDALKPSGAHFLDGLVALGFLKLDEPKDEPKNGMDKLTRAMESMGYSRYSSIIGDVTLALKIARLKIIDG